MKKRHSDGWVNGGRHTDGEVRHQGKVSTEAARGEQRRGKGESIADSRAYHKIKLWGKPLEPRDLTETLERRRSSRRLRLARGSAPASVPFSRNALYYLSQEKRGSSTCLKSKLEELEGAEASSSKGRMRAQRRAPGNLLGLRGVILRSCTNIKNEQI